MYVYVFDIWQILLHGLSQTITVYNILNWLNCKSEKSFPYLLSHALLTLPLSCLCTEDASKHYSSCMQTKVTQHSIPSFSLPSPITSYTNKNYCSMWVTAISCTVKLNIVKCSLIPLCVCFKGDAMVNLLNHLSAKKQGLADSCSVKECRNKPSALYK